MNILTVQKVGKQNKFKTCLGIQTSVKCWQILTSLGLNILPDLNPITDFKLRMNYNQQCQIK